VPSSPGRLAGPVLAAAVAAGSLLTGCRSPAPPPRPPSPHPAPLVVLSDVDPAILTDIRYATAHTFLGRPVAGYREPLCLLTRPAAEALSRVRAAAGRLGLGLKVYDCYRPRQAVRDMVDWARQPADQRTKAEFYPRVAKSALFDRGYVGAPTAHSRGSTVDLTLVRLPAAPQRAYRPGEPLVACTAPPGRRFPDNSVDMGTGYDCFDPLAATAAGTVTGPARANRRLLVRLMAEGGFVNYPTEWWHYRLSGEPFPETYFDVPVARP
jgi:D-alanyl-D-alanine dipeptidase